MVDETEIFKGEENTLIMTQSYTHEFHCDYKLATYPFDSQVMNAKLIPLFSSETRGSTKTDEFSAKF